VPNNPTFYVWGSYPEAPNSPNTYTPWTTKVRKIVQVNLTDCLYPNGNCGGTLFYNHPELLAVRVAQDIYNEVGVYGRLTNDTVAVLLQNFAYDSNYHDRPKGVAEPTLGGARFFTVNDRLNNLIGEWQFDPQPHYPTRRSEDPLQYANREAFDFGSARSYRHPFIENARPGAPLQAWMQTFVDALEQQYQTRLTSGQPIPNPKDYIWTFDVEPIFLAEAGPNGVWFLDYLADPAQYGDTTHTYWNNPAYKVPGTNKTLQELYNDYRIANNLTGWPIDNPKTVLCAPGNTNFSYFHVNNAAFLMWYHELCLAVKDQVLSRCFHGVLQAKWGDANHRVRTSNYGDMTVDGAKDVYGWTLDRPWNTSVTLSNQNNTVTSWTPTEKSNRWQ
jgi:hypothetical protein